MTILQHLFKDKEVTQTGKDSIIAGVTVPKGYVNLTEMCKASGKKKLNDYLRLKTTQEYLKALEVETGIPVTGLVITFQGSYAGDSTLQGTWGHIDIAIDLASWINVEFRIWANRVLRRIISNEFQALTEEAKEAEAKYLAAWGKVRKSGITIRNSLTDAIQEWYKVNKGAKAEWEIYAIVTNIIYVAIWGLDAIGLEKHLDCPRNKSRDYMDADSLEYLKYCEHKVADLIEMDCLPPILAAKRVKLKSIPLPTRHDPLDI